MISKPEGQAEGAKPVGRFLTVELARPNDIGVRNPHAAPCQGGARLQIHDERLAINALAGAQERAIDEDIVGNRPRFGAGEEIPAEFVFRPDMA